MKDLQSLRRSDRRRSVEPGAPSRPPNASALKCDLDVESMDSQWMRVLFPLGYAYLIAPRIPLLIVATLLHPLEEHVASSLCRRITRLDDWIRLIRTLWHQGFLFVLRRKRHAELERARDRIQGALGQWRRPRRHVQILRIEGAGGKHDGRVCSRQVRISEMCGGCAGVAIVWCGCGWGKVQSRFVDAKRGRAFLSIVILCNRYHNVIQSRAQ